MLNKDEIEGIAKATAEIVKAVPVYQDTVQPVAQEVGKSLKTLGGVINIALAPLSAMVYGFDLIKQKLGEELEKRLSSTLPENVVAPQLQVVGPLLEKYKYVHENEDLSQMFVNLLANAMDKNQIQKAHPSFVNIISELSPDEAKLIKIIDIETSLPKLDIKLKYKTEDGKDDGFIYTYINFTLLGEKAKLGYPELTPSYISNLERLNIISSPVGHLTESYTDGELYKPLEEHVSIKNLQENLKKTNKNQEIELVQGIIKKTDFGRLFMAAVLNQNINKDKKS